jgi:phenylacetate-CoA ligase
MRALNRAYLNLVLPFFERRSHQGIAARFARYEQLEKNTLEENKALQWTDLKRLLSYAYVNSPFYKKRFDAAGLRPEDISSPLDLQQLPILTREDIANHLDELRSNEFSRETLRQAATGGTTDTPVPILRSPGSEMEKAAVQLRFNAWAGFFPGDKVFYLWGARQDYAPNPSWRWRIYDNFLMRRVWAPTSVLNPEVLESHRQLLNRLKPRIIYAYPTPLALFCEYLREASKPFHRPFSAICTAEPLFPEQRNIIEEVLGCRVFEHYGSREFGMIAGECEQHNGMHINTASAFLEYLPVESSDTPGLHEIYVTDLLNYGMPLIRYRVNDCVLTGPEKCACGRGYPLVRQIIGRTGDVFQLPNGDRVPGVAFTNRVLQVCPGLAKTQIIQETLTEFRLRYVPGPTFSTGDLDLLRNNLRRFMPDGLTWTFEQVSEIPREKSGKTRFCISRIATARTVNEVRN